ncbi:hypothetical protein B4923_16665 [Brenneria roseae subsp. americana]|uniref:Uncharacterized protein n=1 Tax=Brenneria roseae subsp. americana TaxID=1508507 RepID=A0A2U1TLV1_9GAMM|nr:hypothetical protein B4923_16665 [Brenneria roseae subsp. americana]
MSLRETIQSVKIVKEMKRSKKSPGAIFNVACDGPQGEPQGWGELKIAGSDFQRRLRRPAG